MIDFFARLPDDLLHCIGKHLSNLTSESIVDKVQTACHLRTVGNPSFTTLSNLLYEEIEPGCTRVIHIPKPLLTIPDEVHTDAAKRDEFCKQIGTSARGSASVILEKLNKKVATLNENILNHNKKVCNLKVCPLNDATRVIFFDEYHKRITATRAKTEFFLTEDDLENLQCDLAKNPHSRFASCMRLYLLREVRAYCKQKYGSLEDERGRRQKQAQSKHDAKAQKRNDRMSKVNNLFTSDDDPRRDYCEEIIKRFVEDAKPCFRDVKTMVLRRQARYDALVERIPDISQHMRHRVFTKYITQSIEFEVDHVVDLVRTDILRLQQRQERTDRIHQLKQRLTEQELHYLDSTFANCIENTNVAWESFLTTVESIRQRLREIRLQLQEKGCTLRSDSVLCDDYIVHNKGCINHIVDTMVEMKFFFEHTNYAYWMSSMMRDYYRERRRYSHGWFDDEDEDEDDRREIEAERKQNSKHSKQCALEEWVRTFASKEQAKNSPYLPSSLKSKIDRISFR